MKRAVIVIGFILISIPFYAGFSNVVHEAITLSAAGSWSSAIGMWLAATVLAILFGAIAHVVYLKTFK